MESGSLVRFIRAPTLIRWIETQFPHHPQTDVKLERLNRALEPEAIAGRNFADLSQTQQAFDRWRNTYNGQRPHESLSLQIPVSRYRPSALHYPERLPPTAHPSTDTVDVVGWDGGFHFAGRRL